jgi:hypothetical protein
MNAQAAFRPRGMQVHAVPENERYTDSTGRRLPWALDKTAHPDLLDRRDAVEKGPFGRSMRRRGTSRSRSKTAEPRKEEDKIRMENMAAEDALFGRMRQERAEKEVSKATVDPNSAAGASKVEVTEPMEVLIYGFGEELQWAAIDFYESVSNGVILEDYERQPPNSRQPLAGSSRRMAAQRTLSRHSLRRKNTFAGGDHWIKVTFDSPAAALLACDRSPHLIRGHLVYAEPYRGAGPSKDDAIQASNAGAQLTNDQLPKSFATNAQNVSPDDSETLSSATAAGAAPLQDQSPPRMGTLRPGAARVLSQATGMNLRPDIDALDRYRPRAPRITGVTRTTLLPANMALMPKQPKQSWTSWVSGSDIIGATVPRREDGAFDYDRASFYWRLFHWLDMVFGLDFCGLKGEE